MPVQSTASPDSAPRSARPRHPASAQDSGAQRALAVVETILVAGETLQSFALQRRIHALFHRRAIVAATTSRLIMVSRGLLGGYETLDMRWQDLKDARISAGPLSATLTIASLGQTDLASQGTTRTHTVPGLRKDQAQEVYRICQATEQAWREKRRIRELEEMRAKSGGVQVSTGTPSTNADVDPVVKLQKAAEMLDKGLITDAEYESLKARVVSSL